MEVQQETEPAEPQKERVRVKGVYISGYMAGSEGFQAILDKIDQTEINAVVIDVKNDDGRITFSMDDAPTVNEIGASERYIRDIGALMADLKARGIYTIARVVAFRDPYLAEKKPEWSLKNADGSLHREMCIRDSVHAGRYHQLCGHLYQFPDQLRGTEAGAVHPDDAGIKE